MKSVVFAIFISSCCTEGANQAAKFVSERDLVAASAEALHVKIDRDKLADVPVVQVDNPGADCDETVGCFCTDIGCETLILPTKDQHWLNRFCPAGSTNPGCVDTVHQIALHEYVHAALWTAGIATHTHPPIFWQVWGPVSAK